MNTFIVPKFKVKSVNDVSLPARTSNKLTVDSIRLGAVHACDK